MYFTGQNLALGHADWASVIRAWNDEIKYFTYGSADNVFGEIGHFTQVLISYNGRKTLWQIYLHLIGFHHILCLMIKINLAYSPIIISRYSNNWYKILCLFGTLVSIIFVDQRSLEFVVQMGFVYLEGYLAYLHELHALLQIITDIFIFSIHLRLFKYTVFQF